MSQHNKQSNNFKERLKSEVFDLAVSQFGPDFFVQTLGALQKHKIIIIIILMKINVLHLLLLLCIFWGRNAH